MARSAVHGSSAVDETTDAEGRDVPPRPPRRHAALTSVLLLVLVVGLSGLLWAISAHAVPGNSDGATVVLEGKALAAGHLTLHRWFLSLDSFWLVDALFYAVAVLVGGVRPELLNLVPAVIASIVIVVGMVMGRDGRRGVPAAVGSLTVAALLALPSYAMAVFFLQGPLHVGTVLWCLLAFLALARPPTRTNWVVAVLLLGTGNVSDLQTIAFGVAPVFLAGMLLARRTRSWRAGVPAASAAAVSVVLALVLREAATLVGTFTVNGSNGIAKGHQMLANFGVAARYTAHLLGVGSTSFGSGGVPGPLLAVHVVGLAVVVIAVLVVTVAVVRSVFGHVAAPRAETGSRVTSGAVAASGGVLLDDLLVLAFFGDVVVFVILTPLALDSYARYLTAAVIFGAILAGRVVARFVPRISGRAVARPFAVFGTAVLGSFAAATGYLLAVPVGESPPSQLGAFLEAHHLHQGIGDYWSSSIVTVETSGAVVVRPVTALPGPLVVSYTRNSDAAWYTGRAFQFLVYNPAYPFGNVDTTTATSTYGPPEHTYAAGGYDILVWRHRITVASGLGVGG